MEIEVVRLCSKGVLVGWQQAGVTSGLDLFTAGEGGCDSQGAYVCGLGGRTKDGRLKDGMRGGAASARAGVGGCERAAYHMLRSCARALLLWRRRGLLSYLSVLL